MDKTSIRQTLAFSAALCISFGGLALLYPMYNEAYQLQTGSRILVHTSWSICVAALFGIFFAVRVLRQDRPDADPKATALRATGVFVALFLPGFYYELLNTCTTIDIVGLCIATCCAAIIGACLALSTVQRGRENVPSRFLWTEVLYFLIYCFVVCYLQLYANLPMLVLATLLGIFGLYIMFYGSKESLYVLINQYTDTPSSELKSMYSKIRLAHISTLFLCTVIARACIPEAVEVLRYPQGFMVLYYVLVYFGDRTPSKQEKNYRVHEGTVESVYRQNQLVLTSVLAGFGSALYTYLRTGLSTSVLVYIALGLVGVLFYVVMKLMPRLERNP